MRVLLTGATGFIGSHVAREMVSAGCEVYAVVRRNSDLWRIEQILPSIELIECDLLSAQETDRCLDAVEPDLCVHSAWYVETGKYWNSHANVSFLGASLQLALGLAERGCRRFVGIGTGAEYEPAREPLVETRPTAPGSLYVASKIALWTVLGQLGKAAGMEVAWARVFYLYGPREPRQRLVPSIILSLLADEAVELTKGDQIRDVLHVEDIAAAIWAVADSDHVGPINIASGKPISIRDLAAATADILGRSGLLKLGARPYNPSEPMCIYADNSLLSRATSWVPRYTLEQGLRHSIDWWKAHVGME